MTDLQSLFSLKGQVALVTGASSGLGVEFAKALATAGADVAIMARRKERLEQLAEEIAGMGVRCLPVGGDVSDADQREAAFAAVEAELGPLKILVNNAGIAPAGRAEKQSAEQWESALRVNLSAVFYMSQRAARSMIERGGGGRIINISSAAGHAANSVFHTVGYTASKGGVELMTKQLAIEWAKHSITVNTIAPGWFKTEMNTDPSLDDIPDRFRTRMEELTPMGRLGQDGELMGALVFLASPAASYVTGSCVHVDGGWLTW